MYYLFFHFNKTEKFNRMKLNKFLAALKKNPRKNSFIDTIEVIGQHYDFIPTAFNNGSVENKAGEHNGSCKIFAFARLHNLDEDSTLACFGEYYFEDVLKNPEGTDHENIRNFMKTGWEGIHYKGTALLAK